MNRNLSLITPTGRLTLGNYLGAFRGMAAAQATTDDCFYGVSDLHAMTDDPRPAGAARHHRRGHHAVPRGRARPGSGRCSSASPTCRPTASWPTCWSARRTPASWRG